MNQSWFRRYPSLKKASAVLLAAMLTAGTVPAVMPPGMQMFSASTVKAEDNAYKKTEVDLSKGLKQGVTYGDDEIASISVLEDMSAKTDNRTVDGVSYENYIQGKKNASQNKGAIPTEGSVFKIKANTDSTIYFAIGTAKNKQWHFVEEDTKKDLNSDGSFLTEDHYSFRLTAQKTYYFYLDGSKPKVYGISLTKGSPSINWDKVAAPKLESPTVNGDKVTINYTALIGDQGAEKLDVNVSLDGKIIDTLTTKANGESGSISYQPLKSGDYTFEPVLKREGKEDKRGESVNLKGFVLPLSKPSITAVTDKGGGKVEVTFDSVKEAEKYLVSYSTDGKTYTEGQSSKGNSVVFTVPQTGKDYYFRVTAERGNDQSVSDPMRHQVNDQWKATWLYSAFGQGVSGSSKDCGYQKISDDSARVYDINGKGKLVPASTDGLSFYYTKVPSDQNFTLSADVNVNTWKYSNGQEGFGLMASDDIGENGDASVFWNNSYMASVTKVLYNYDKDKESATDNTSFPQYTMKLGVGSQEKSGVTKENLEALNNNDTTVVNRDFTSKMSTLETAAGQSGQPAGTYNIVGKRDTSSAGAGPDLAQYTSFKLQIQKNNTGYFVSYTDPSGKTKTQKYYDTKALEKLDPDYVYAGIFASRNCDVTAKNISLTTRDPKEDAPAEKIEMKKITPIFKIDSPASANGSDYTLRLTSNYDGKVTVKNSSGEAVAFGEVHKGEVSRFPVKVEAGKNTFTAVSQPNEGYQPDKFSVLSNYKENTAKISVSYFKYDGDLIYVGPDGKGRGTKKSLASIYDAVKYAAPGQTIVLLPGKYDLKSGLMIPLGTNGTKDQPIKMIADPSKESRPVLDFSQAKDTIGLEIAGDYWYLSGFDVTNAPNGKDGIHVSGSFNTLDRIHAYHNGNTGIQISRIGDQQANEEWPAHNLILNCTSYANADAGYEDADGFAAKLTIGEGNIFDGCIAYNNADDGWDLFAKPETGSIGSVTIKNCLAYGNGYGLDGTDEGNGNGFKMGGSSLSGHHRLVNSVAFNNKAKGIDSNSCPDIEIENSISFNNGGSNVALYTTDAKNTDFSARGIISYRKGTDIAETIKPKGSQDIKKIYQASNFFWKGAKEASHDASKEVSDAWFKSDATGFDLTKHTFSKTPVSRNADGTIRMNGLLELTDLAIKTIGKENACLVGGQPSKDLALTGVETKGLKTDFTKPAPEEPSKTKVEMLTIPMVNESNERLSGLKGIQLSSDTIVKNQKGEEVALSDVKVIAVTSGDIYKEASERIKKALKEKGIKAPSNGSLSVVEVYLTDQDKEKLSVNGQIEVTLDFPKGTSEKGYTFLVYHLKDDGSLETLKPEVTKEGLTVKTTSLSPFAILASPVTEKGTKTSPKTGEGKAADMPIALVIFGFAAMMISEKKRRA